VQFFPVPAVTRRAGIIPVVNPPGYRATVCALATGQLLSWAALYYAFSSFVVRPRAKG